VFLLPKLGQIQAPSHWASTRTRVMVCLEFQGNGNACLNCSGGQSCTSSSVRMLAMGPHGLGDILSGMNSELTLISRTSLLHLGLSPSSSIDAAVCPTQPLFCYHAVFFRATVKVRYLRVVSVLV